MSHDPIHSLNSPPHLQIGGMSVQNYEINGGVKHIGGGGGGREFIYKRGEG